MESVIVKNQTRSQKKRNNNNNRRSFSENQPPTSFHGGFSHFPHRSLSFSYPLSSSAILSHPYLYQQSPPLLPLPVAPISRNSSLSLPLTPPKQRRQRSRPNNPKPTKSEDDSSVVAAPAKVPTPPAGSVVVLGDHLEKFSGGSALTLLSPPPSSLPLPRFSLRPAAAKLSCNAEAAGFDAGATDNLRRILRLR